MNRITKKKQKRKRKKAFLKKLRRICCGPSEVDSLEDVQEEETQAAGTDETSETASPADATSPADVASHEDAVSPADAKSPADAASHEDAASPAEAASPADVASSADTASPADAVSPAGAASPADTASPTNARTPGDTGTHTETTNTGIPTDSGTPETIPDTVIPAYTENPAGTKTSGDIGSPADSPDAADDKDLVFSCDSFGQTEDISASRSSTSSSSGLHSATSSETQTATTISIGQPVTQVRSEQEPRKAANAEPKFELLRETFSDSHVKKAQNVRDPVWPAISSVRASFHQGSALRFRSRWVGSQCTTMSLTAVAMAALKPVNKWTKSSLHSILYAGDKNHGHLLAGLDRDPQQLKISEESRRVGLFELKGSVPIRVKGDYHILEVCRDSQSSGIVFTSPEGEARHHDFGTPLLKDALAKAMDSPDATGAVFTVGDYSTGLIRDSAGVYRLWDSHSRSASGFHKENGTAVLLAFRNLEDVQTHIELQLRTRSSKFETYDVVGFHVHLGEDALKKIEKKRLKEEKKELKRILKEEKKEQKRQQK